MRHSSFSPHRICTTTCSISKQQHHRISVQTIKQLISVCDWINYISCISVEKVFQSWVVLERLRYDTLPRNFFILNCFHWSHELKSDKKHKIYYRQIPILLSKHIKRERAIVLSLFSLKKKIEKILSSKKKDQYRDTIKIKKDKILLIFFASEVPVKSMQIHSNWFLKMRNICLISNKQLKQAENWLFRWNKI